VYQFFTATNAKSWKVDDRPMKVVSKTVERS
jgi:hypothetical protein